MQTLARLTLLSASLSFALSSCAHRAGEAPAAARPPSAAPPAIGTPPPTPSVVEIATDTTGLPRQGDYVYVQELPEAITRVAPDYPEAARAARIDGTVMVQALVGKDGAVQDVRVVKSIPELDGAAKACVRQWKFKPAKDDHGQPVTVWVGVPIKFTLH